MLGGDNKSELFWFMNDELEVAEDVERANSGERDGEADVIGS